MSVSYILSVKRLLLFFGALHAKDSRLSCPIMMHHRQISTFMEYVGCSQTNVSESTIVLNEQHYLLTYV